MYSGEEVSLSSTLWSNTLTDLQLTAEEPADCVVLSNVPRERRQLCTQIRAQRQ